MQRVRVVVSMLAAGLCLSAGTIQPGTAETAEPFYKGKTINFLVASVPGGVNDLTARLISRHLGKHIPGNPNIVVQNLQSSGLALANRIYNTPGTDGLTIGIVERGAPQVAIMGDTNARFDPLKITWLGSVSSYGNDAYTLSVNSTFTPRRVEDLRKPDRPSAKIGSTGAGATNGIFTNIAKDVLGLNIQHVRGYRGAADVFLAQQRNELDGQVVGCLDEGRTAGVVAGGRVPAADHVWSHDALWRIPGCPDRARADQGPEGAAAPRFRGAPFFMALPLVAPPGLPADRAAALQTAFMAMIKDPAFVAEALKMNLELSPIDGEAVRKVIAQMQATPPEVIEQFKTIAGAKH